MRFFYAIFFLTASQIYATGVIKNTLITTPEGDLQVQLLCKGDSLYACHNMFSRVISTINNRCIKTQKTRTIFTDIANITMADDQEIMTQNGWQTTKDLQLDDDVMTQYGSQTVIEIIEHQEMSYVYGVNTQPYKTFFANTFLLKHTE